MKTVLITGANSGIGFETVKLFLQERYTVFAHYNSKKNNLELLQNKNLILLQANFRNSTEVEALFLNILQRTNTIDVLVNNAGLYKAVLNFDDLDLELINATLDVNLIAPFLLAQKYIQLMKSHHRGRIINISSIGVKYGGSVLSMPYTFSKSALESMTLSLSKESAKYNILVNALRVGVTNTNIHNNRKDKNMKNRINMIPLARMAEPIEIAEYILFLASSKSSFTTGSIISIAGGE